MLLLDLEFSILDVEIEDTPNIIRLKLWDELILPVPGDVGDVAILASEELQDLADLHLDLRDFLGEELVTCNGEGVNNDFEDPLSLFLEFLLRGAEPVSNLDLEPLWDVLLDDFKIVRSSK